MLNTFYAYRKVYNYCIHAHKQLPKYQNKGSAELIHEELYLSLKQFLDSYVSDLMKVNHIISTKFS